MNVATVAVMLLASVAVLSSWLYFRRWEVTRPPLGTVNLGDVAFTLVCVIMLPMFYLWFPGWLVGSLLVVITLSALWLVIEPITTMLMIRWSVAGGLVAADVTLAWTAGTTSIPFLLVNDVVVLMIVVGISNLWAQGGLRARNMAILAGAIAIYDLLATGFLPITTDMIDRLSGMPFLPMAVWPFGSALVVGIGLGDLLLASVGPLVMRKAFGRGAGLAALAVALGCIAGVLLVAQWEAFPETFPTMVVLGPVMVLQYGLWSHRSGKERTYAQYLADDPSRVQRLQLSRSLLAENSGRSSEPVMRM